MSTNPIRTIRALALSLSLAAAPSVHAQPYTQAEIASVIDPVVTRGMRDEHIPGAVVLVVKDGQVVFQKGYGYADLDRKATVSPESTIFRIGSISKVFTATAIVQLADRGKLSLQDDVNLHLKDIKVPATYPQPITVENLITHTGGLDEINLGRKTSNPNGVLPLGKFLSDRLIRVRPPAQTVSYSTYGISLAGHVAETVSGLDFHDYLRRNIFEPLGMTHASIGPVPKADSANLATGYAWSGGAYRPLAFEYFHTFPASDINGTAADMAAFMLAELESARGRAILSDRARLSMQQRHAANAPQLTGITYGFFENRRNGVPAIEHSGSMEGFTALMYLAPAQRLGIYVAYNRETAGLSGAVKDALLDHYFPRPEPRYDGPVLPGSSERLAGRYRQDTYCHSCTALTRGFVQSPVRITANPDGSISLYGARWVQVEPLVYRLTSGQLDTGEVLVAFRADAAGRITHMFSGGFAYEKLPE